MSNKSTKGKKTPANANEPKGKRGKGKSKKAKPEQLKIPGTGRVDAIEAIEKQAESYVTARDARMENQVEEEAKQEKLTALLKEHKLTEYVYEDGNGTKRRAYIPAEAQAKVQKVKAKKADASSE